MIAWLNDRRRECDIVNRGGEAWKQRGTEITEQGSAERNSVFSVVDLYRPTFFKPRETVGLSRLYNFQNWSGFLRTIAWWDFNLSSLISAWFFTTWFFTFFFRATARFS